MRVIVTGGDGYLGWPQAMYLSKRGYEVCVVDNFCRRLWDLECGTESLIPICPLHDRVAAWRETSGKNDPYRDRRSDRLPVHQRRGARLQARRDRALRRAAQRAVLDDRSPPFGADPGQQPGRHAQRPSMRFASMCPNATWSSSARWANTEPRTSISKRALSRLLTTGASIPCPIPSSPARSTTCPRSTILTTSTSPAKSGESARPISTRASSTASRPTRRCSTSGWRRVSITTESGEPC